MFRLKMPIRPNPAIEFSYVLGTPAGNTMPSQISATRNSESRLLQSLLPSSLASIVFHGLLIAAMFLAARGCEKGVPVDAGGNEYRTVGLTLLPDEAIEQADSESPPAAAVDSPRDGEIEPVPDVDVAVPETVPSVNELLEHSDPSSTDASINMPELVGPGAPLPGLDLPPRLIPPPGGRLPGASDTPGPDTTAFMDIADSGKRFVYLIDTSGSMHNGGRMELAQSQLLASLRMLEAHQEFQVIFYGDEPIPMRLKGGAKDVYRATAANIILAKDEIETVDSGGGTRHLPALLAAFKLKPDVVYFLTDGQDASLTREDLRNLLGQNSAGSRVHVVEFAPGAPESRRLTWLHSLASETGGKYLRVLR